MRYPASEKLEIIRIVKQSHLPARRTLEQLGTCEYASKRIEDWAGYPDHEAYLANLKLRHRRKAAFWNA